MVQISNIQKINIDTDTCICIYNNSFWYFLIILYIYEIHMVTSIYIDIDRKIREIIHEHLYGGFFSTSCVRRHLNVLRDMRYQVPQTPQNLIWVCLKLGTTKFDHESPKKWPAIYNHLGVWCPFSDTPTFWLASRTVSLTVGLVVLKFDIALHICHPYLDRKIHHLVRCFSQL